MSRENAQAALAQSVERRLGKAEVGGSIPLNSLEKRSREDSYLFRIFPALFFILCNALSMVLGLFFRSPAIVL